jgi:hypothetical protein
VEGSRNRILACFALAIAASISSAPCTGFGIDPVGPCVTDNPGGPKPSGPLRAASLQQQQCINTYNRYVIPDPFVDFDYDLLYSGYFTNHPYMSVNQPRDFLRALDLPDSAGKNEFHIGWTDTRLNYNYFHAADTTAYYNDASTPHMVFFPSSTQQQSDRDHIDVYLFYPPADGDMPGLQPSSIRDQKEDLPIDTCNEYIFNSVQSGAVHRKNRVAPNFFQAVNDSDATWYASDKVENSVVSHETQHLFYSSAGRTSGSQGGFPNETFSKAAEYLVGAKLRDATRPGFNTVYDRPLPNEAFPLDFSRMVGLGYSHWYLWMAYLLQQFPGDTTKIEDDLLYKYARYKVGSTYNNNMHGLAQTLAGSEYASLGGSTGNERLRNLVHNYSLAKWINNPSTSFHSGRYGFSRGLVPSGAPGFFDNTFNPCDKRSALEVPPTFLVGSDRATSDSTISGHWCVTDVNQGDGCTSSLQSCDTLAVWLYGADYIQFKADPYFNNGKQNTLHFKMTWNTSAYPGTGSGNNLRVSAISYPITSDSLYLHGNLATTITDAVMDTLHGFAEVWVPNFGTSTKSVVLSIDLGEVTPPTGGDNARQFFYGYSFGVDVASPSPVSPLDLKAYKVAGSGVDSLKWTDPGSCGSAGYYIQRSFDTQANPVTFDSTAAGVFARAYPQSGDTLRYYRVIPKTGSGCNSNFATLGGHVRQNQTVNGVLYLSGDLTVDYTKILTLDPGTLVRIRPGMDSRQEGVDAGKTELTVNGRLNAIGTAADSIRWLSDASAPAAGDWRGIRMLNASDNASQISYNAVRFATHGLYVEECAPKIDHCRIQQSAFYGIYAWGDSMNSEITNCILEQNHGAELGIVAYAVPTVKNCHLRYSPTGGPGAIDDGAAFSVFGAGVFRLNRIIGVGMGVFCATSSNPSFIGQDGANPFGRNDILEFRTWGVRGYDLSFPVIGLNDGPQQENHFQSGRNNIFSTGYPSAVFVQNSDPSIHLKAQYCYWNGVATTDTTKFKGPIDNNRVLASFDQVAGPGWYYPGYQAAPALLTPDDFFADALSKELAGDADLATAGYRSLIIAYPNATIAAQALGRLLSIQVRRGKASDELTYASTLAASGLGPALQRLAKRYLPSLLLASGQRTAAEQRYAELLGDPQIDRAGVLLEIALVKAKEFGDRDGARAAITELQQCCVDRALLKHARAMLEDVVGSDLWIDLPESDAVQASPAGTSPEGLSLEQSAPNPMNPRTTLRFSLSRAAHVTLRIFDIRGRLVRTLVADDLPQGSHMVEWDGRTERGMSAASGVYHYRLEALGKKLTRRLIVLK